MDEVTGGHVWMSICCLKIAAVGILVTVIGQVLNTAAERNTHFGQSDGIGDCIVLDCTLYL